MARIALVHDVAGVAAVQAELLRSAGHEVDELSLPVVGASWDWPAKAFALPLRLLLYWPAAFRRRAETRPNLLAEATSVTAMSAR